MLRLVSSLLTSTKRRERISMCEGSPLVVLVLRSGPTVGGVTCENEVDAAGKCYRLPNIPGFEGVEIKAELQRRTGAVVTVENDATTAAHVAWLHIWRLGESARLDPVPATITDCLNYGNPEVEEVFWEFSEGVRGIGDTTA